MEWKAKLCRAPSVVALFGIKECFDIFVVSRYKRASPVVSILHLVPEFMGIFVMCQICFSFSGPVRNRTVKHVKRPEACEEHRLSIGTAPRTPQRPVRRHCGEPILPADLRNIEAVVLANAGL